MKLSKPALMITLIALSMCLIAGTLAALTSSVTIPASGTITALNLGVYSDSDCTQTCTSFNLGQLNPGSSQSQTIYIKNTGNVPETLTLTASSWSPSGATTYLTLSWNKQNAVLAAGASTQATLTLTAASDCGSLTNFSCSITITGTQ
jgi:hypothetical protein